MTTRTGATRWPGRLGALLVLVCGIQACEKPTESEPDDRREFSIRATLGADTPVRGATVRIPLGTRSLSERTGDDGRCTFYFERDEDLPPRLVATIEHASIMPDAVAFDTSGDGDALRRTCVRRPSTTYVEDVTLHHLGNDRYGGDPNSQLQIPSQGISQTYRFHLDTYPSRMPTIRLYARGIQHPTRIQLNGQTVSRLGDSDPSGGLSRYNFRLGGAPRSVLRPGMNTLTVHTAPYNESDPWDDIEFCALMLYFE